MSSKPARKGISVCGQNTLALQMLDAALGVLGVGPAADIDFDAQDKDTGLSVVHMLARIRDHEELGRRIEAWCSQYRHSRNVLWSPVSCTVRIDGNDAVFDCQFEANHMMAVPVGPRASSDQSDQVA